MRRSLAAALVALAGFHGPAHAANQLEMQVTYQGPGNGPVTFSCHAIATGDQAVGLITGIRRCTLNGSLTQDLAIFGPYVSTSGVSTAQWASTATACMEALAFYSDVTVTTRAYTCKTFVVELGAGMVRL